VDGLTNSFYKHHDITGIWVKSKSTILDESSYGS